MMFFNVKVPASIRPHVNAAAAAALFFWGSSPFVFADFTSSDSYNLSQCRSILGDVSFGIGQCRADLGDINAQTYSANSKLGEISLALAGGPDGEGMRFLYNWRSSSLSKLELIETVLRSLANSLSNQTTSVSVTNVFQPNLVITNDFRPSIVITNDLQPVFSITNDFRPNIIITNESPIIQNVVSNFVFVSSTNTIPMCYDLTFLTNAFYTSLVYPDAVTMDDVLDLVDNYGMFSVNQTPFYWASIGFPRIRKSNYVYYSLYDKIYSDLPLQQQNVLFHSLDIGPSIVDSSLDSWEEYWGVNLTDYLSASEVVKEKLYGTYDIEAMLKASTNHFAEISNIRSSVDNLEVVVSNGFITLVATLLEFTNSFQNVSVSSLVNSNQFSDALDDASSLMPAHYTDTSVSSITNPAIYSTADNSYLTALQANSIDETQFDYSGFQQAVQNFVSAWQNGINPGDSRVTVHFMGVDMGNGSPTLEQTIEFDFRLPQEAETKVNKFWGFIFGIAKASLILWGFFQLFNAVLRDAHNSATHSQYIDALNADIDD